MFFSACCSIINWAFTLISLQKISSFFAINHFCLENAVAWNVENTEINRNKTVNITCGYLNVATKLMGYGGIHYMHMEKSSHLWLLVQYQEIFFNYANHLTLFIDRWVRIIYFARLFSFFHPQHQRRMRWHLCSSINSLMQHGSHHALWADTFDCRNIKKPKNWYLRSFIRQGTHGNIEF